MKTLEKSSTLGLWQLPVLLRGETEILAPWLREVSGRRILFQTAVIVVGAGLYGAAVGAWRAPLQSLYLAVKLPLILVLTALFNGVANGMLAPLLGLNVGFRQSLALVLTSFAIAATVLGGFSPIMLFLVWNAPVSDVSGAPFYVVLLTGVVTIAFAGVAANMRLLDLLRGMAQDVKTARSVLFAWLAGNLFLGAQISWNLRPFIGSPEMEVEFLRDDAFSGNFYEAVLRVVGRLISGH
jgi:hypothetical protein